MSHNELNEVTALMYNKVTVIVTEIHLFILQVEVVASLPICH